MSDTQDHLADSAATAADEPVTPPVLVQNSAVMKVITTVLRYLLTAVGAWFVTKGYFSDGVVNDAIGGLLIILPTAIGGWLSKHQNDKLKLLEQFLPNSIARRV